MKKKNLLIIAAVGITSAMAQNTFPTTGNVGVGTNTPTAPFTIRTTLNSGNTIFDFGNPQQFNQVIFRDRSNASFLYGVQSNQIMIGATGNDHKMMSVQNNYNNVTLWPVLSINSTSNIVINPTNNVGIGTTSPSYKLDVNGSHRINGNFINMAWTGGGNRLVQVDASGNITPFAMGNSTQILFGDGSWGAFPAAAKSFTSNGNILYTSPTTSLGIGTNNPQYPLDVLGDARVSNNLYVGGGVVITSKVDASLEVKAGDLIANNNLTVNNNAKVVGSLTASQGIMFDNANTIGLTYLNPSAANPGGAIILGKQGPPPPAIPTCLAPNNNIYFQHFGWIQPRANNGLVNSALTIGSAPWDGNGILEVEGSDNFGGTNNALMINYFCGRNTLINVNNGLPNRGGIVYMGEAVSMARSAKIGYDATSNIDPNTSLAIWQNIANGNGVQVNTYSNIKAFSVLNPVSANNPTGYSFYVNGDGKTQIGTKKPISGQHDNSLLTVYGDITTTALYVTDPASKWADFVFDKNYKLLSIQELEKFYKVNHHLPNVPTTKEMQEKGNNLGETDAILLQKIEELTLYLVQQQKEIEYLKTELKNKK